MSYDPTSEPFKWMTLADLRANPPPIIPFLWGGRDNGLMQEKSFVMLHASEKMGKSMFTLNFAVAGARGDATFLGIPIRGGGFRTLILQCEVSIRGLYERFQEMLSNGDLTPEQAANISINGFRNAPLDSRLRWWWLRYKIRRYKPDVVIVDPLARMLTEDENSNVGVGKALAPLLDLRDNPGCAVLVVHHDSKVGDANAGRPAHQRSRGANRLTADPDSIWSLTAQNRKGGPTALFSCTARYGKYMQPFRVRMNENTFWFERYSKDDEYTDDVITILAERDLDEDSLIALLVEKWKLNDAQHNHRTLRQRLAAVVETGRVRVYEAGNVIVYTVPREERS